MEAGKKMKMLPLDAAFRLACTNFSLYRYVVGGKSPMSDLLTIQNKASGSCTAQTRLLYSTQELVINIKRRMGSIRAILVVRYGIFYPHPCHGDFPFHDHQIHSIRTFG